MDALNESPNGQRAKFLEETIRLQAHYGVKLMVTSQDMPEIAVLFQDDDKLEIIVDKQDLKRYAADNLVRTAAVRW